MEWQKNSGVVISNFNVRLCKRTLVAVKLRNLHNPWAHSGGELSPERVGCVGALRLGDPTAFQLRSHLVFESPVQSGLSPKSQPTGTATGCNQASLVVRLD